MDIKEDMEPVVCELKYSGAAPVIIAAAALGTLAIVCVLPWAVPLKGAIALAVAGMALRSARIIRDVRMLRVDGDGTVEARDSASRVRRGALRDGSFVAPWLTIVRWRPAGCRFDQTVAVLPGMLDPDVLRRLRILLRSA